MPNGQSMARANENQRGQVSGKGAVAVSHPSEKGGGATESWGLYRDEVRPSLFSRCTSTLLRRVANEHWPTNSSVSSSRSA